MVKHFCTTANRVKEDVVEFVKNIDWKKVAVGVGVTMAFTGVVLLSGGSAAPVLLSAAIGSGSGAVFNGVLTAMNGGSIADIAESASDGFMWGAIGGSFGGGTTVLLSESAAAGSSLMGNPFFQRLVQGAADTAVDTAQSASKGLPVTPEGIVVDMVYNTLMAGGIGSGGKQAVNEAVDETADSIGDSVRREVKSGSGSTTPGFDEWLNKGNVDNKVYFGVDKNGNANYTGITKQAKDARLAQHNRNGKDFFDLEIQYDNLTRNQARAIEQYFIENGPNELNKINSIGYNNKYYQDAYNWAKQYLGK